MYDVFAQCIKVAKMYKRSLLETQHGLVRALACFNSMVAYLPFLKTTQIHSLESLQGAHYSLTYTSQCKSRRITVDFERQAVVASPAMFYPMGFRRVQNASESLHPFTSLLAGGLSSRISPSGFLITVSVFDATVNVDVTLLYAQACTTAEAMPRRSARASWIDPIPEAERPSHLR